MEALTEDRVLAEVEIEHRPSVAHLDAVVQEAGVELTEIAYLGVQGSAGECKEEKKGKEECRGVQGSAGECRDKCAKRCFCP